MLFIPPIVRSFPAEAYVDGLSVFAGNQQAYDPNSLIGIERIDVLKGPTATLYGGGIGTPLGGVINLESVSPNDKAGGHLAMRAGSFSTWNPYGDINLPLADGVRRPADDPDAYLAAGDRSHVKHRVYAHSRRTKCHKKR